MLRPIELKVLLYVSAVFRTCSCAMHMHNRGTTHQVNKRRVRNCTSSSSICYYHRCSSVVIILKPSRTPPRLVAAVDVGLTTTYSARHAVKAAPVATRLIIMNGTGGTSPFTAPRIASATLLLLKSHSINATVSTTAVHMQIYVFVLLSGAHWVDMTAKYHCTTHSYTFSAACAP
eukprot:11534-Heterococcus_DN1.PRE.5